MWPCRALEPVASRWRACATGAGAEERGAWRSGCQGWAKAAEEQRLALSHQEIVYARVELGGRALCVR